MFKLGATLMKVKYKLVDDGKKKLLLISVKAKNLQLII